MGCPRSPGTSERWFSKEPSKEEGPRPRECGEGNGGAGVGSPRRVGRARPGVGAWGAGRTDTVWAGLMGRGGMGRAMEGLRGWSRELQMVRASVQKVETFRFRSVRPPLRTDTTQVRGGGQHGEGTSTRASNNLERIND